MPRTTTRRQAAAAQPAQPISDYARVSKSQSRLPAAAVKKAATAATKAEPATKTATATKAAAVTTRKRKAAAIEEEGEEEKEVVVVVVDKEEAAVISPVDDEKKDTEDEEDKDKEKEEAVVVPTADKKADKDDKKQEKDDQEEKENPPNRAPTSVASKPRTPAKRARRTEPTEPVKTPQTLKAKAKAPAAKSIPNPPPTATPSEAAKTTKTPSKEAPTPGKGTRQSKLEDFRYTSRKADNGADLIRLHGAFLKTVLLHVAHHGRDAPIDIAAIAPNIARNWGKRQVGVDDIRRCVAIETSARGDPAGAASPFVVCDYGRGRVCVELKQEWVRDSTTAISEARLCEQFEANIRHICAERARDGSRDVDLRLEDIALADLPRAEVVDRDDGAAIKANPLLARGHRALSELKNGLVEKQQARGARKQQAPAKPELDAPAGPKMSLLDRIRHKQLAKANGPLPPSAAELRRRAALNRVADVAATVSMLSLAGTSAPPRQAFTMTLVSDKLRDSLRVPVSRDEGVACIRLIAEEVAPEWIKIVTVGGRENVVIQRDNQPVDRILQDRVQKLLG